MNKEVFAPPHLTLASASESRRKLLESIGVSLDLRPVRIDEGAIRDALAEDGASPRDTADALAEFKTRKAAPSAETALVLGCDQILALKGEMMGKSETRDGAKAQLQRLRGQTHHLYSAAVIYEDGEPVWRHVGTARMSMHDLSDAEIDAYLDLAWPEVANSVGAYHAESHGARLFSRIDGDWFSVLGLPLLNIATYLRGRAGG